MEPHGDDERDENFGADPTSRGDGGKRGGGQAVIGTDDPAINPGLRSPATWLGEPDQIMSIETSRIRGPSEAFNPNLVLVPVESARPQGDSNGAGQAAKKKNDNGNDEVDGHDQDSIGSSGKRSSERWAYGQGKKPADAEDERSESKHTSGDRSDSERGTLSQKPSLFRVLLFSGLVSLVCGVIGAAGFSYLFGKSSDEKSSGKGRSGTGGSSKGADSSQGSDSSGETGASENSDTSKNSDPSRSGGSSKRNSDSARLLQTQAAWLTAVNELHDAKAAEKSARRSEEETRAVLDFVKNTLLSAGRPGRVSLAQAFWANGQGKDVTLRKALDASESQVAGAFGESPIVEASVRELLGAGYLSLGDAEQAVKEYERALALRQAVQGATSPDTAACRNQLAVAYRVAGRTTEGARLFDNAPSSPAQALALALSGSMLLAEKKAFEAELKLRESLAIRQRNEPDLWTTFDTKSMLGQALLDQKKFTDAEPLLLSGYQGMKEREDKIAPQDKPRLAAALERVVRLYEEWGKKDVAAKWRGELNGLEVRGLR